MTAFTRTAIAAYAIMHAVFRYTALAQQGDYRLFKDSKSSKEPTNNPTHLPTTRPSNRPSPPPKTSKPLAKTTRKPSPRPSSSPTLFPLTVIPTNKPTRKPSKFPTRPPTLKPTPHHTATSTTYPTNVPTVDPSKSPSKNPATLHPTPSPSNSPITFYPSTSPTNPPSTSPTQRPITSGPTLSPSSQPVTLQPTASPSNSPVTLSPSISPTNAPSTSPTQRPVTSGPTISPSSQPVTLQPTASPSNSPVTLSPSISPTNAPSISPTQRPVTSGPTMSPSSQPVTLQPTASPSNSPMTLSPSISPTNAPSISPTQRPVTSGPTISPSSQPVTLQPTASPSNSPMTLSPSISPTNAPRISPTQRPVTSGPTSSPSSQPVTLQPTASPSNSPVTLSLSISPTNAPSISPTQRPVTSGPTLSPISQPVTLQPTASPSNSPMTLSPSISPTNAPSISPTQRPVTSGPTISPSSQPVTLQPTASPSNSPMTLSPSISPTSAPSANTYPPTRLTHPPSSAFFLENSHADKLITIKKGQCFNGNNVQLWQNDNLGWQQWVLNSDNTIESIFCPGLVLDIARDDSSCDIGMPIIVSTRTLERESQEWAMRQDGVIESTICPGMGIDIRGFGTSNGAFIHLWSLHLEWNQVWEKVKITPSPTAGPSTSTSPSTSSSPSNPVSDPFVIRNDHTDKLITIKEGQCFNGNNVQLWQNDNLGWQQWVLNSDNNIESVFCPGLVLDIARDDSSCDIGMPIIVSTRIRGRESQQWTLRQDGVIESSICPGMGIDIRGYGTSNGAFIHLWSLHLQWNQIWQLDDVQYSSLSPRISPFASPSTTPSISSTVSTSIYPSINPSSSQSASPSRNPSNGTRPSASPNKSPSSSPSRSPNKSPFLSPSTNPGLLPSAPPATAIPTISNPTTSPSDGVICHCGPVEPIRQRSLLELEAPFSFESPLRRSLVPKQVNGFVIDESLLEEMKLVPPTVVSDFGSSNQEVITDVVSLGTATRLHHLTGQIRTWGSHNSIRRFWGFTEDDDFFDCSSVSDEELKSYVQTCKTLTRRDKRIQEFFTRYYGLSEGNRTRSDNSGWVCAQRRLGRAFGWLHSQYYQNERDIPDYLFLVDDDTFIAAAEVISYLQRESKVNEGLLMRAGCLFEKNDDSIPFNLPYGGFGLFLNKMAIKQLSRPIHCNTDHADRFCSTLQRNVIGEFDVFHDGMTLLELFYKFSATKRFCMHSDWLSGYVIEFYLSEARMDNLGNAQAEPHYTLRGILEYPMCGNVTAFSGSVRQCTLNSVTCHNQSPKDMEVLTLSSFSRSPSTYRATPILPGTDLLAALESIKGITSENKLQIPNVLLVGAQIGLVLADWLLYNGACYPATFDDEPYYFVKEVHFFDDVERYTKGLSFYGKRYEHCSEEGNAEIIIDATPDYFEHPHRVYNVYNEADRVSDLKLIVILQEPIAREASLYQLKVREYRRNTGKSGWFSNVAHPNGTIMSFDDYAEMVLKNELSSTYYVDRLKHWASLFSRQQILILSYHEMASNPEVVQWRVTEFLGLKNVHGNLNRNEIESKYYVDDAPTRAAQVLEPLFSQSNNELYDFLDSTQGPWMEQKPFPRFDKPVRFAYATVLGWSPSSSQNKLYLDAVRVLIRSLRHSATKADIVVLMAYHDPETESLLLKENVIVKLVNRIQHSQNIDEFEPWFADIALAKLRAFELDSYHRVQLLDADVTIDGEGSLDKLFAFFPESKLVSEGLGSDSPIRAGWMMIKPSQSDFHAMESILKNGNFEKTRGWNRLNLPVKYPGWTQSGDPSRSHWNFYGSSLEQGLLFHFFYALPKSENPLANDFELLKLVSDEELQEFGVVHFYGSRKPWSKVRTSLPVRMSSARKRWLQVYSSLDTIDVQNNLRDYVMPLTKIGFDQYSNARVLSGYIFAPTSSPSHAPTVTPTSSPVVLTSSPTVEICHCTQQTTTQALLRTKSSVQTTSWKCVSWSNFTDSAGNTCEHYTSQFLSTYGCEEFGDPTAIPTNPDVTNMYNESIWDACCFCGGGTRIFIEPV